MLQTPADDPLRTVRRRGGNGMPEVQRTQMRAMQIQAESETNGGGMTPENRQKMLDYNEELCRMYNEDESEDTKRLIAFTEFMLFNDPDHVSTEVLEIESV
jgi:hypothetical protein